MRLLFITLFTLFYNSYSFGEAITVELSSGTEIPVERFAANGDNLLVWLPSEAGLPATLPAIASKSASNGIEVWLANMLEAYFLPVANSSMAKIPAADISELIDHAIEASGKRVFLIGSGRATIAMLDGTRAWQLKHKDHTKFGGVIFISPKFYIETPDPGKPPQLLPLVEKSNLPVHIIQPTDSPWRWKLSATVSALEKSGSDVSLNIVRRVRDRFYYRPDATDTEKTTAQTLPQLIQQGVSLLASAPGDYRQAVTKIETAVELASSKKQRELKPYPGLPDAYPLALDNLKEERIDIKAYKGRVVLVNFWASWCPPCVHEMPSMQQMQDKYVSRGFDIVAVNMAEDRETILEFLKTKVSVNFTILMDSDGDALKRWKVFAFPTSFILGKQGRIRYALFGAVDWNDAEITSKVEALLNE